MLFDSGAFATQAPKQFIPSTLIMKPFEPGVWIWILATFSLTFICAVLADQFMRHELPRQETYSRANLKGRPLRLTQCKEHGFLKSSRSIFGFLYRGLLNQSMKKMFSHDEVFGVKVTLMFWWCLSSWVLTPTYSGTLFSFFSIPFNEKPIDSLDDVDYVLTKLQQNFTIGTVHPSCIMILAAHLGANCRFDRCGSWKFLLWNPK